MALKWSARRQILYYGAAALVLVVVVVVGYQTFFTRVPTCTDRTQNGTEEGVDCGGSCTLICASQARAPVVLWTRAFRTSASTYTATAYVQNLNTGGAAKRVPYSFQLFDEANLLVVERQGVMDIPPQTTVPVVDPNLEVGTRTVARTIFSFSTTPQWYTVSGLPALRVGNQRLASDGSTLAITLYNESNSDATRVVVTAVLFDAQGVARAASKSLVSRVARKSSQEVVFTWPGGTPNIIRAEVSALPSF